MYPISQRLNYYHWDRDDKDENMIGNDGVEKIYIAAPFRAFTTDEVHRFYGIMNDNEYQAFLEKVDGKLKGWGYNTCLPHRDEGQWGELYILPEDIAEICFKHIESSNLP